MSKKSFKSPAEQFISNTDRIDTDKEVPTKINKQSISSDYQQKFSDNESPMKPNPLFIETKSKRLQLLMQPSLHQKVKEEAVSQGMSVNEYIHQALENLI